MHKSDTFPIKVWKIWFTIRPLLSHTLLHGVFTVTVNLQPVVIATFFPLKNSAGWLFFSSAEEAFPTEILDRVWGLQSIKRANSSGEDLLPARKWSDLCAKLSHIMMDSWMLSIIFTLLRMDYKYSWLCNFLFQCNFFIKHVWTLQQRVSFADNIKYSWLYVLNDLIFYEETIHHLIHEFHCFIFFFALETREILWATIQIWSLRAAILTSIIVHHRIWILASSLVTKQTSYWL